MSDFENIENWRDLVEWKDLEETQNLNQGSALLCECMCLSLEQVKDSLKGENEINIELLKEKLGFATGCGTCSKVIFNHTKYLLNKEL